jgi:cytoskeletal protein RodZ
MDVVGEHSELGYLYLKLREGGLDSILSLTEARVTLFAPMTRAFENLPVDVRTGVLRDPAKLKEILLSHVLNDQVLKTEDFESEKIFTTASGPSNTVIFFRTNAGEWQVRNKDGVVAAFNSTDIEASNGIVHIIDTLLLPSEYVITTSTETSTTVVATTVATTTTPTKTATLTDTTATSRRKCTTAQFLNLTTNLCMPCPEGTYNGDSSHTITQCLVWTSCEKAQIEIVKPTDISNRVCGGNDDCANDQYESGKSADGKRLCSFLQDCKAGQFVSKQSTKTTDRVCGDCDGATGWQDQTNSPNCNSMSFCGENERADVPGTSARDFNCVPCPTGQEQPLTRHQEMFCNKITTTKTTFTKSRQGTLDPETTISPTTTKDSTVSDGSKSDKPKKKSGAFIGIIVVALAVAFIVLAAVLWARQQRNIAAPRVHSKHTMSFTNPAYDTTPSAANDSERGASLYQPSTGLGETSNGYMDVGVGGGVSGGGASSGYMDIGIEESGDDDGDNGDGRNDVTGYMEVTPSAMTADSDDENRVGENDVEGYMMMGGDDNVAEVGGATHNGDAVAGYMVMGADDTDDDI